MPTFKPATERAIEEAFSFFAENAALPANHILPCVRSLGLPITQGSLNEIIDNKQTNDIEYFKKILFRIVEINKPENMTNEISKAFDALKDKDGKVMKRYLKNLLQHHYKCNKSSKQFIYIH